MNLICRSVFSVIVAVMRVTFCGGLAFINSHGYTITLFGGDFSLGKTYWPLCLLSCFIIAADFPSPSKRRSSLENTSNVLRWRQRTTNCS